MSKIDWKKVWQELSRELTPAEKSELAEDEVMMKNEDQPPNPVESGLKVILFLVGIIILFVDDFLTILFDSSLTNQFYSFTNFKTMGGFITLLLVALFVVLTSIRQVNQYERGVKFQLGKYKGMAQPGWRLVWPVIQSMTKVDVRTKVVDVPFQETITKDNVSARINAVLFYKVMDAEKAIIEVENYGAAVSQLAQTTMRNVAGEMTLDELLSSRDEAAERIREIVDIASDPWGIRVESVELKDIILPEDMVRTIAKQAEAERERRAVIINSEGEVVAADNLRKAAEILATSPGALHLRTLNSINDISSDKSNTIVFAVPVEILTAFQALSKK